MGWLLLVIFISEYFQFRQNAELKASYTWLVAGKHWDVFVYVSVSEPCVKEQQKQDTSFWDSRFRGQCLYES